MSEEFVLTSAVALKSEGSPRYYRRLLHHGKRVALTTTAKKQQLIPYCSSPRGKYINVPIDPCMRRQMDKIEAFVQENVEVTPELQGFRKGNVYKSLYRGASMNILLDYHALVYYQPPEQFLELSACREMKQFGSGEYTCTINFDEIYIGLHKDGSIISLVWEFQTSDALPLRSFGSAGRC